MTENTVLYHDVKNSLSKEKVLYVGDSLIDAQTAQNAEVEFAGVLTGITKKQELEKYNPVYVGNNITDIYQYVQSGLFFDL